LIGEQLFVRSTRQVTLTEFGEGFYQQCKSVEEHWQSLGGFLQSHKAEPQGKLKIAVSSRTLGLEQLFKKLDAFTSAYPQIELDINVIEEPTLASEKDPADILFGFSELPGITDNLKYKHLSTTRNILCASPAFIKKYGMPKKAEDLVNYKFINHSLRNPSNVIKLADGKEVITAKPHIVINSFEALTELCAQGLGIFLTGESLANEKIAQKKLVSILPDLAYREFKVYLFYRPMMYEQANVRAFVDFYK
jgi:DNA-binding transcriptional LysR family regulator